MGNGERRNEPVHGRSGGIPTRDAEEELGRLDTAAFGSRDAGVASALVGLVNTDADADPDVSLQYSTILPRRNLSLC